MEQRLLVVGGGGARGAWSGGFASHLRDEHKQPYKFVFGTSTGSLLAPLIVLDDFATLKTAYTSVTQSVIFNVNPFTPEGNLRPLNALWRFITHKDSFGETQNLLKEIKKFLTPERYQQIQSQYPNIQFTVATISFTTGQVEYYGSGPDISYEKICNWIWASSNEPLFMSFVESGRNYYADGGVRANVPVVKALAYAMQNKISDIDVIVSKPIQPIVNTTFKPDGILNNLLRLIELWETEVRNSNIQIAELLAKLGEAEPPEPRLEAMAPEPVITLHVHYIPVDLFKDYQNELVFDQRKMQELWAKGQAGEEDREHKKDLRVLHKHINWYLGSLA
jgi:NTE family protein